MSAGRARRTRRPPHLARSAATLALVAALTSSGCLGTFVESSARSRESYSQLTIHLLAAPAALDAAACRDGLAEVTTWVPLWGLAVGIFTLGIVVPQSTIYTCAQAR